MTLGDLVELVKRDTGYGDISNTTDQITKDIVKYVNNRRYKMWRFWDWDWTREAITITLTAGTSDYTLDSTIGDIIVLDAGEDDYVRHMTLKKYLQWIKRKDEAQGTVTRYVKLGRDSSGNLKLRFWRTPDAAGTITGFGKKRLTAYVIGDVATNTGLEFFPVETHDILFHGVRADVLRQMKDAAHLIAEAEFRTQLEALVGEDELHPDEDIDSSPPDRIIFGRRNRGGTTVA